VACSDTPRTRKIPTFLPSVFRATAIFLTSAKSYTGNITFVFTPDVSITIPNHQFVRRDWLYDNDGHIFDYNSSFRVYRLSKLEQGSADNIPLFGQPFFTSAYLQVDEEKGNFRLSANRLVAQENITAINSGSCGTVDATAGAKTSSTQPSSGRSSDPAARQSAGGRLSSSIVIGIVVCIVFAASATTGIWFWRRRVARCAAQDKAEDSVSFGWKSELADEGVPRPPAELETRHNQSSEAKLHELPASALGEREGQSGRSELPIYALRGIRGPGELQAIRAGSGPNSIAKGDRVEEEG
jgi:hypothetical protein